MKSDILAYHFSSIISLQLKDESAVMKEIALLDDLIIS